MKKIIVLICAMCIPFLTVDANKEIYFQNEKGVILSKKEYDYISQLFYEGYQNFMEIKDYNDIFFDPDVLNTSIETNSYKFESRVTTLGLTNSTLNRTLKISKSCISTCTIALTVEWQSSPLIKSYDVIGTYLDGLTLVGAVDTKIQNISFNEIKKNINGFGVSVKIPTIGNPIITQRFKVTGSGTIYGSYQHATKSVTLSQSKSYTISKKGLGKVFLFEEPFKTYYDNSPGVDITI